MFSRLSFITDQSLHLVQARSVADNCGLKAGDGILVINNQNTDEMTHEMAKMAIIRSSNDIDMIVQRGAVQIWKPKVTPMSELRPNELRQIETATGEQMTATQKTSLARDHSDEPCTIGSAHNRSARPFPGSGSMGYESPQKKAIPKVVHAQFNSPIGLYSPDNIATTYAQQTAHMQSEMENLDVTDVPVGVTLSGGTMQQVSRDEGRGYGQQFSPKGDAPPSQLTGFRSVAAPVTKPAGQQSPKPESMHCQECGNLVTGVFVRVKGLPYHEKCFKCASCGLYLKQKGYFIIEGKLYCETHARRMAQAPGPDMKYAGSVY
ncbi:hypothetical protein ACJMK2_033650, partial [Sinanodonta woodiana]